MNKPEASSADDNGADVGRDRSGLEKNWIMYPLIPQPLTGLKKPERYPGNLIASHFMRALVRNSNLWAPMQQLIILSRPQA